MPKKKISKEEILKANEKIEEYWKKGDQSRKQFGERMKYGNGKFSEVVRNARNFSKRYSEDQLEALLDKSRETNFKLSIGHIDRLVSVADEPMREDLETQMLSKRWSCRELYDEISLQSKRREGLRRGRRVQVPDEIPGVLVELTTKMITVIRWGHAIGWDPATGKSIKTHAEVTIKDLPPGVARKTKTMLKAALQTWEAAEAKVEAGRKRN